MAKSYVAMGHELCPVCGEMEMNEHGIFLMKLEEFDENFECGDTVH